MFLNARLTVLQSVDFEAVTTNLSGSLKIFPCISTFMSFGQMLNAGAVLSFTVMTKVFSLVLPDLSVTLYATVY